MNKPISYMHKTLITIINICARKILFLVFLLTPLSQAYACAGDGEGLNISIFIGFFVIIILAVSFITLFVWLIRKVFKYKTNWHLLLFISTVVVSVFVGIFGAFGVPQYAPLYEGFGTDLPIQTRIVLSYYHLLWLPLGLVAWLWYVTKNKKSNARYIGASLFVMTSLLTSIIWALYSPIFKMGSIC